MNWLSARSIRTGTTVIAAVSLAVSLVLATRAIANAPDTGTARVASQVAAWVGGKTAPPPVAAR